jgi:hypothetical protein
MSKSPQINLISYKSNDIEHYNSRKGKQRYTIIKSSINILDIKLTFIASHEKMNDGVVTYMIFGSVK